MDSKRRRTITDDEPNAPRGLFAILPAVPVIVLFMTGCATSVLPTSYLEHGDAGRGGRMRVCWTDERVKMYSIPNVVVLEFATDKALGMTPVLANGAFGCRIRDILILDLRRFGKNTTHDAGTLPVAEPFLLIDGNIAQLNPGSPEYRYRFGFGAGRALVDLEARVYLVTNGRAVLCAEFAESEAKSSGVVGESTRLLDFCLRRISRTMTQYIVTHGKD